MIYSTNRTASLGYSGIEVDVNESYFGAGAMLHGQECAQDELALFEAAIKSDIDECLIGESSYELEALNESFVHNAIEKIKGILKKFIEWIKSITRSAFAKLTQLIVRDNAKFVKIARERITKMKNYDSFKYEGKAINTNSNKVEKDINEIESTLSEIPSKWKNLLNADISDDKVEEVNTLVNKVTDMIKDIEDKNVYEEVNVEGKEAHKIININLEYLDKHSKTDMKNLRKQLKKNETDANTMIKDISKLENKKENESEDRKKRLSALSTLANNYKSLAQKGVTVLLRKVKEANKIARAVVTKAMGVTPKDKAKNEGMEYTPELIDAIIETTNYEYDEALEEMSEAKEPDVETDDEDIDDEEK